MSVSPSEEQSPRLHFPNGFDPQSIIFSAHRVQEGGLTLVRDPVQAIIAAQSGIENVIAFLTPTISAQQLEQLALPSRPPTLMTRHRIAQIGKNRNPKSPDTGPEPAV